MSVVENRRFSDLNSVKRGYFVRSDTKWEHSLLGRIPGHPSPFDVSSIVLVNTIGGAGATNKPGNRRYFPANLQGARAQRRPLGRSQRVAEASVYQTRTVVDLRCL